MNRSVNVTTIAQHVANDVDDTCTGWENINIEDIRCLRHAAEQGSANAQYNLAKMYFVGQGVRQSYRQAAKWFRRAGKLGRTHGQYNPGHAGAQYRLAKMYWEGLGVRRDHEVAGTWFRFSAAQGYDRPVKWFSLAAERGDPDAQYILGEMYFDGLGVPQSYEKAIKWHRLSAKRGNTDAQYCLDLMYSNRLGIPQDNEEAVKWFRLAAEQGDKQAQCNLGCIYRYGEGVPIDEEQAAYWFRRAKGGESF